MSFPHRLVTAALFVPALLVAQDERYHDRPSDCRYDPPPGKALEVRQRESAVLTDGFTASRVSSYSASASNLSGGDIRICSEYGRVEISDSDDDQVHVQIRWDGFGEGTTDPAAEAARVIDVTPVRVFLTADSGRLFVRVWHPFLGFTRPTTAPGGQPAWVSVRVLVPDRGAYRVSTEAFHGVVSLRRLTLSGAYLSGRVGEKLKGINGFQGGTELYDVTLAGNLDVANPLGGDGAPVTARLRIGSSSQVTIQSAGAINVAVQPHPDLGVRAFAAGATGARVAIPTGTVFAPARPGYAHQAEAASTELEQRPRRVTITAISGLAAANVSSTPALPLAGRRF